MNPATILVTLVFLLADGRPAKNAAVTCQGLPVFLGGDDAHKLIDPGAYLLIDKRGALILDVEPKTITCEAKSDVYYWKGPIHLKRHGQVEQIWMESY